MLNVAIIGSGFGLYGLLPAFNSLRKCRVVAVCGSKSERLLSYCNSIGLKNIYTEWHLMLNEEKIDILAIAVPPAIQYEIAKMAIEKGMNIFAEKPLAVTYKQALDLFNSAKKRGVKNAVDFIFPYIEEWQKVKNLINTQKFGRLLDLTVNWDFVSYDIKNKKSGWKTDVDLGGGALSYYFSHTLFYMEYFAGKIKTVSGSLRYSKKSLNGGEVGVDLSLKFQNGIKGKAHLSCDNRDLNKHQLIFTCEKGQIILETKRNSIVDFIIKIQIDNENKKLAVKKEKNINGEDERVRIVKKIASAFIDCCIKNTDFSPSFKEALSVQKLIDKIRTQQA